MRENRSRAQTYPLKHVLMPAGVVCTSALASNRCNPLPYSASTGRLLVLSSWHSGATGFRSFDMDMMGFGVYAMRTILQKPSCYNSGPRAVLTSRGTKRPLC